MSMDTKRDVIWGRSKIRFRFRVQGSGFRV
jgi:hypothetical protein